MRTEVPKVHMSAHSHPVSPPAPVLTHSVIVCVCVCANCLHFMPCMPPMWSTEPKRLGTCRGCKTTHLVACELLNASRCHIMPKTFQIFILFFVGDPLSRPSSLVFKVFHGPYTPRNTKMFVQYSCAPPARRKHPTWLRKRNTARPLQSHSRAPCPQCFLGVRHAAHTWRETPHSSTKPHLTHSPSTARS